MIHSLFQRLLNRSGKNYKIDENIPPRLLIYTLYTRLVMLLRGIVFYRKKIFVGKRCVVSNKHNVQFGTSVTLEHDVKIDGYSKRTTKIGNSVKIGAYSWVSSTSHFSKYGKGLVIGDNSAVGKFTEFGAAGGITIGNDVIMGSYISFHSENHNFEDTTKLIREQGVTSKGIIIGNNVWVGAKVTFLDGAQVGNNCVIAAGAVVTKKFPNNVIIGGVPAKILKEIK